MIRTTTAATMVSGSEKENVLPIRASAVVNFRILPGDTVDSGTERVIRVIDDPRVTVAPRANRNDPSPVSSRSSPYYRRLERATHEVSPEDDVVVAPCLLIAQTDSRHFTSLAGGVYRFLGAKVTAEELDGFHGTDESIAMTGKPLAYWLGTRGRSRSSIASCAGRSERRGRVPPTPSVPRRADIHGWCHARIWYRETCLG